MVLSRRQESSEARHRQVKLFTFFTLIEAIIVSRRLQSVAAHQMARRPLRLASSLMSASGRPFN